MSWFYYQVMQEVAENRGMRGTCWRVVGSSEEKDFQLIIPFATVVIVPVEWLFSFQSEMGSSIENL
jgi:hypothetical protein